MPHDMEIYGATNIYRCCSHVAVPTALLPRSPGLELQELLQRLVLRQTLHGVHGAADGALVQLSRGVNGLRWRHPTGKTIGKTIGKNHRA